MVRGDEREAPCHGGKRGREPRDERQANGRAAAAGAAREQQGASRADLARGVPGDLQRQQEMGVEGSHVIMISQPQAVTDHILKAARAVAGSHR